MMFSEVDKRVDSGEIETVYLDTKCHCKSSNKEGDNTPKKAINKVRRVKIIEGQNGAGEYRSGNDLYLK